MLAKMKPNPAEPGFEMAELISQEEAAVFDHFSQKDALALGEVMLEICREYQLTLAIKIVLNGMTVFKYMPEGTGRLNDVWMEKKVNTVLLTGWSTMRFWVMQETIGKKRDNDLRPEGEYAMCGGGFPIRVNGVGVVGAIACSGTFDQEEHLFCVEALKRFTGQ